MIPPACADERLPEAAGGWLLGGHPSAQHNTHPGFNKKGDAAPVFPRHAASNWHRHTFVTSFLHYTMNVPSSSPPSPPQKVHQIWERAVKGVVPFAAAVQPPLPSHHPCLPSAVCGQQLWGGQPPAVPGACFPWGHQASFHTAASLKPFPKLQAGSEALQPKHPGDVATGHFFT